VEPDVLLLDEPLKGLDEKLRRDMETELKRIHNEVGTTFVFVTHHQEEALSMSDRIAVINLGRLEQLDTPSDLYEHPANAFVADFVGGANIFRGTVVKQAEDHVMLSPPFSSVVVSKAERKLEGGLTFMVRPEKMKIGSSAKGCENLFEGKIVRTVYKGTLLNTRETCWMGPALGLIRSAMKAPCAYRRNGNHGLRCLRCRSNLE